MARQFQTTLRNTWLQSWEDAVGASGLLEIFTGSAPANCAAADSGTKLVSITLPADAMSAPSSGSHSKSGTWSSTGITNGTAAHYRIKTSGGTVIEQGTVTVTGGGGDMTVDNTSIATSQTVTVTSFTSTAPGA